MKTLTATQEKVLRFIEICQSEGFTPTLAEISRACGWSSGNAAFEHLQRLEAKGYIERPAKGRIKIIKRVSEGGENSGGDL